ncbi:hypothetical protein PMIN06_005971 [Paraphaeosphaeria minitans]
MGRAETSYTRRAQKNPTTKTHTYSPPSPQSKNLLQRPDAKQTPSTPSTQEHPPTSPSAPLDSQNPLPSLTPQARQHPHTDGRPPPRPQLTFLKLVPLGPRPRRKRRRNPPLDFETLRRSAPIAEDPLYLEADMHTLRALRPRTRRTKSSVNVPATRPKLATAMPRAYATENVAGAQG